MNRIVPLSAVLVSLGLASLDAGPAAAQFRERGSFGGGYQAPSGNFARETPGARQPTGDGPRFPGGPRYPRGPGGYGGGYYGGG
ncbi:MAG: hypothetical protein K2P80_00975, partial [Beijerinckiaceae bacterium]|nr:hypothetical protein [Beijerinckiaceae bacterium]